MISPKKTPIMSFTCLRQSTKAMDERFLHDHGQFSNTVVLESNCTSKALGEDRDECDAPALSP